MRSFRRKREYSRISPLVKYFLFFENFLVWLLGLAFTAIGAYVLYTKDKVVKDAFDFFLDPATLMCTGGAIVVVITFFGCMGALRENVCFLKTYNYILGFIFLLELALVTFIFVFYYVPDASQKIGLLPTDAIEKYGVNDDEDTVSLIDNIQKTLHCCGLGTATDPQSEGYLDWNKNIYYSCVNNTSPEACSVPSSCCIIKPGEEINVLCGRGVMKSDKSGHVSEGPYANKIYKIGCIRGFGDWIKDNAIILGGIMLGILLPQLFIMCLSRSLRDQIKAQKAKWNRGSEWPGRKHDKSYNNPGYNDQ